MADAWRDLGGQVARLAEDDGFSGVLRVTQGDDVLLEEGHGWADRAHGVRNHAGTRFGLASLSKMFTAAAVLETSRRGELDLTDRVAHLLPAARRPRMLDPAVTVHHLLTHTSGIGDYAEEDEDLPGFVDDYGSLWRDRPCYRMERPDDFLPLYADLPPVGAPGAEFHYCNAGYVLLGAVLEEVTGDAFVDAVTERVLMPAGMTASGYFRSDEPRPDVATGYLPRTRDDDPWCTNVFSVPVVGGGDGGACATATDIDAFLRAVADGSLLGPAVTARMRTPYAAIAPGLDMGYGVMLRPGGAFGHGGGDPGVEVISRHLPERDLTVVLLCNVEGTFAPVWALVEPLL